ncbi:MAG TPA: ABC transporter permease [Thermoanaerobaculia bacterium]|nr:ABC transporter permease [Thermoanaerobaculia bacterium]
MPFEILVAIRFLREGRIQTLLILSGIGVGVGVIVFLSALISGLQSSLIERTLGTQAHVVVRAPEDVVRAITPPSAERAVAARFEQPAQRLRSIVAWPQTLELLRTLPGVRAAAPTAEGPGVAQRGLANRSIALRGVEPSSFRRIIDMTPRMTEGEFRVDAAHAVLGVELAAELGLKRGDKLRIQAPAGRSEVFVVAGLFDVGNKDLNERWVFVSLRSAQTLLDLSGGISTIELKVDEIFSADRVAAAVASRTGLEAESWMERNRQLLIGLRSQSASSWMIQLFVVIAVALGIASVLVVSVVQKSREIGILKAMGTRTAQVVRVFLVQGAVLGLAGSAVGILLGSGLALFFAALATNPDGSPTFPVALTPTLFLGAAAVATVTGLVAAVAPAERAASLDPADVIRHG